MAVINMAATNMAVADDRGYISELNFKAKEMRLWQNREWLNLLHYAGNGDVVTDYKSEVRDSRFFLAPDGKTNPESELQATIAAFYNTDVTGNENAQCKFIARFQWLKQRLSIDMETLPAVHCDAYLEWRTHVHSDLVTLVFPAYHLNSPSSMFGHTLIRLDSAQDEGNARWLSTAINFGANVDESDNSILYAFKGLVGGYSGIFVTDYYYKKIQEYNRIENRDIWEYRLNLTTEETNRIVTHLWELQGIQFDYYYFDENCSYRLLELLQVARPGVDLTSQFKLTAIPVDTVRAIAAAGMIESEDYRPSQATQLQHLIEQVPQQDRELIIKLSQDITVAEQQAFVALPPSRQKTVVDIAYQYISYQHVNEERDPAVAKRRHQLLLRLNSYPKMEISETAMKIPVAPEKGHGSKRVSFGLGKRLDNNYLELGIKMSFHDLEDNERGFLRGAQINIINLQLRAEENEGVSLYKFDLIDIFSLTPRTQFFKPLAWKAYVGLERQLTNGVDQLAGDIMGGVGGSWLMGENTQVYALATGGIEMNKQFSRAVEPGLGFLTGMLQYFSNSIAHLELSGVRFIEDVYRLRAKYVQNFVLSTNHSIKFVASYEWQKTDEYSDVQLGYQYYF